MAKTSIGALVVDDFEPFRRFVRSILQNNWNCRSILEASDGAEAVALAQELQPDLVLLDIGLPILDGIEAARRIRQCARKSKIIFVSQETSSDVVREALGTGAMGYVVKADAESELVAAVNAVLRDEKFIGSRFAGHDCTGTSVAEWQ